MRLVLVYSIVMIAAAGAASSSASSPQVPSDTAGAAVARKLSDVKTRLASMSGAAELRQGCDPHVASAEQALSDDRLLVALAGLRRCLPLVAAGELAARKKETIGPDLDRFRDEWRRAGEELRKRRDELDLRLLSRVPLAVRAMVEAELQTFEPYYTSSRLYGENTTVESGLMYLGFPYGILEFASFAISLPLQADGEAFEAPDLHGALFALDGELLDFYKREESAEVRSALIGTNALFKLTRDLQRSGARAGSLLEYLRTIESFSVNRARQAEPPPAEDLRGRLSKLEPLRPAGGDHSIATYFVERAGGLLSGRGPGPDERRYAAAILDEVLPAYARVRRGDLPASAPPAPGSAAVTVTLVRWPYT